MVELRWRVRNVIYGIGAIIIVLILLRFFLHFFGVSANNEIINLIYQISYPFIAPFRNIAADIAQGSVIIELTSIIALVMWMAFTIIFAELVTGFLRDSFAEIIVNLIDSVFKIIEFLLLARFLFRAFGVPTGSNGFIDAIYTLSSIVYTPFAGIAPGIKISTGVIELSTLIALVVVILIDAVSDGTLRSIFGVTEGPTTNRRTVTRVETRSQPAPVPQQINVYMPQMQQMPPQVIVQNPQTGQPMQVQQMVDAQGRPVHYVPVQPQPPRK